MGSGEETSAAVEAPKKAYDLGEYVKKLKTIGLNVGEETAKQLFLQTFDWVEESADISATPFDNLAVGVVKPLKEQVLKLIDKIDGEVG